MNTFDWLALVMIVFLWWGRRESYRRLNALELAEGDLCDRCSKLERRRTWEPLPIKYKADPPPSGTANTKRTEASLN